MLWSFSRPFVSSPPPPPPPYKLVSFGTLQSMYLACFLYWLLHKLVTWQSSKHSLCISFISGTFLCPVEGMLVAAVVVQHPFAGVCCNYMEMLQMLDPQIMVSIGSNLWPTITPHHFLCNISCTCMSPFCLWKVFQVIDLDFWITKQSVTLLGVPTPTPRVILIFEVVFAHAKPESSGFHVG